MSRIRGRSHEHLAKLPNVLFWGILSLLKESMQFSFGMRNLAFINFQYRKYNTPFLSELKESVSCGHSTDFRRIVKDGAGLALSARLGAFLPYVLKVYIMTRRKVVGKWASLPGFSYT
jgi:hypothetical protein